MARYPFLFFSFVWFHGYVLLLGWRDFSYLSWGAGSFVFLLGGYLSFFVKAGRHSFERQGRITDLTLGFSLGWRKQTALGWHRACPVVL